MKRKRANSEQRSNQNEDDLDDGHSLENQTNLDWVSGHSKGKKRRRDEHQTVIDPGASNIIKVAGIPKERAVEATDFYCQSLYFIDQLKQDFAQERPAGWCEIQEGTPNLEEKVDEIVDNCKYSLDLPDCLRGKWSQEEHDRFLEGIKLFGKRWPQIAEHIGSRSIKSVISHGQKFLIRLVKFLEENEAIEELSLKDAHYFYGILKKKTHRSTILKEQREQGIVHLPARVQQIFRVEHVEANKPCYLRWKEQKLGQREETLRKENEKVLEESREWSFHKSLGCSVKVKRAEGCLSFKAEMEVLEDQEDTSEDSGESQSLLYKTKFMLYGGDRRLRQNYKACLHWIEKVYHLMAELPDLEDGQTLDEVMVCMSIDGFGEFNMSENTATDSLLTLSSVFSEQQYKCHSEHPNLVREYKRINDAKMDNPECWENSAEETNHIMAFFSSLTEKQLEQVLVARLKIFYKPIEGGK